MTRDGPDDPPLRVDVRPVDYARSGSDLEADLASLDRLAKLLDSQFSLGGISFGWDSIIGLVPVAGDVVTSALGLYPVYLAAKHDLGKVVQMRMLGNVGLDFAMGSVPLLGDAADVAFKSNRRNLELFRKAAEKKLRRSAT